MLLSKIEPSPILSPFVREYRVIDFQFPIDAALPSKAYPPRPEHCLQFFPRDTEKVSYSNNPKSSNKTSLIGQHTTVFTRHVGRDFLSVQVVLKPGALFRFTGIPSIELTNKYINAEDVLGMNIREVNEKLFVAVGYPQMIQIVEHYLSALIKRVNKEQHVVDTISLQMLQTENLSLDVFVKQSFLCHRQFDRRFRERIGLSPKQYLQIIRFDRAFRLKNKHPEKDWLTIALHCGYYDYQHLVRDYKLFTGCTPNEFAAIEMDAPERSFGDVEI